MVFKQSGHCISFSWVVSWTICTGFLHYELSNIACMEQECKVAPLFEVLVDFLDSLRVTRKFERVYKLYWMEHCHRNLLCPLFIVFFFWKWILFVRICKWFVSNQRRWTGCQVPTRPAFFPAAILARVSVYSTSPLLSPYLHLLRLCTTVYVEGK